jgi:hypothetical protein
VVVAASLEQGVQWCERVLGITPGPGGEHALMGTHNRLFSGRVAGLSPRLFRNHRDQPRKTKPARGAGQALV